MSEPMQVWVEVWPVAADEIGVWLISGDDAWRPALSVSADSEPHGEVELTLASHGVRDRAALVHSTSWRVHGPAVILTYMTVVQCDGLVRGTWKNARPVGLETVQQAGRSAAHAPTGAPVPRSVDVLLHGLRHLKFLADTDAANSAALGQGMLRHLRSLQPALAGMYDEIRCGV